MSYTAQNPERVLDKMRECRFFLTLMADYEKTDTEKFLFSVSAFLCAFRSVAYRLLGVVQTKHGETARRDLRNKLDSHLDIGFLKNARDMEVHGDGVKLSRRYTVSVGDSVPEQSGRFRSPFQYRYESRFRSRFSQVRVAPHVIDWQFEGHPSNVIELCHDALNQIEEFIRQAVSQSQNSTG